MLCSDEFGTSELHLPSKKSDAFEDAWRRLGYDNEGPACGIGTGIIGTVHVNMESPSSPDLTFGKGPDNGQGQLGEGVQLGDSVVRSLERRSASMMPRGDKALDNAWMLKDSALWKGMWESLRTAGG